MSCRARFGPFLLSLMLFAALPAVARAAAILSINPTSINVQGSAGTDLTTQTVQITNAGNGALKWSVVPPAANWLVVSPTSGINSGTLTVTFRTSALPAGAYASAFTVQSESGSSLVVPVAIQISGGTAPAPQPPSGGTTSPSGTTTPPAASIVDAAQAIWTVVDRSVRRDGVHMGTGDLILWQNSTIYVNNQTYPDANGSWWQWTGGGWSRVGDPRTGTTTSSGTTSPDGTATPPAASIVDASGATWTVVDRSVRRNGVHMGTGDSILWKNSTIYVNNLTYPDANGSWWQWTGSGWTQVANPLTGSSSPSPSPTPAAPSPSAVGPQSTITCPAGAVDIWPGQSIPSTVNAYGGATTFCLRAGVHYLTSAIRPKTGNTFVGEYGAILDGSNWSTTDDTQGAFRAHNEDIDYVTIRNLVIRRMPQSGIHTYYWMSNHWTIEYNEIAYAKIGIEFSPNFVVRNNYIHHNVGSSPSSTNPAERGGGYQGFRSDNSIFEGNEIAYNGREQKVGMSANVTFRNNFVHHNIGDGIWYDTNENAGALIEGNRVEDNGRNGIFFEASSGATIRNNTIRRHSWDALILSMSQSVQIYNNVLEGNYGGIAFFLNCDSLALGEDVKNNAAYDNTVVVGTQSYAYAAGFSHLAQCTSTQVAPYLNGSKNLTYSRNTYRVPSLSGRYLLWGGWKYWYEWQNMGQDVGGSMTQ